MQYHWMRKQSMQYPGRISTKALVTLLLALVAVAAALLLAELALRLTRNSPSGAIPLHVTCGECPYLYRLNPDHPDVLAQNQRFPVSPDLLQSTFNVMILGDSVAYGVGVPYEDAFPQRLRKMLASERPDAAVLNMAVSGYTPYTQLHQYKSRADDLPAELVVVVFTMNDVVDPELHWNYTEDAISNIPRAAYPNIRYHEEQVVPILEARRTQRSGNGSELAHRIRSAVNVLNITDHEASYRIVDGRRWPTYITGEDTIGIDVLTDYASSEWVWLRGIYDQLAEETASRGAQLVIVIAPLAYQMDPEYPFLPQTLFAQYCAERSLPCLDLLPAFRKNGGADLFIGQRLGYLDVWHFSDRGHAVAADEIRRFLKERDLIGHP